jgi:hypothetical protein
MNIKTCAKKGMAPVALAIIAAVSLIGLETIFVVNYFVNSDVVHRTAKETEAIEVIDSMEFLKRSMQHAVVDSLYTSSFDVMERGGYDTFSEGVNVVGCSPYWRVHDTVSEPDIEAGIKSSFLKVFNCYGKKYAQAYSIKGIMISTPDYSSCGSVDLVAGEDAIKLYIKDGCKSGFETSREFISVREKNANFIGEVKSSAFNLFWKAIAKFVYERPVLDAVDAATSDMECTHVTATEQSCSYENMKDDIKQVGSNLLNSQCSDWRSSLKNSIDSELSKIMIENADVDISFSDGDMSADYRVVECSSGCEHFEVETDECVEQTTECSVNSDCCGGGSVGTEVVCNNNICGTAASGTGHLCTSCIKKTVSKYKTSCSYEYSADVDVGVSVKAEENAKDTYYPIYSPSSGKTEWRQPVLKFRIIDGDSGQLKPETSECEQLSYC